MTRLPRLPRPSPNKSRNLSAGVTLFLAALSLSGCKKAEEAAPTPEVEVQIVSPHQGTLTEQVASDSVLSPLAQANLQPKITAPISKFLVQRGARVKAGQLLVVLENRDLSAAAVDNQGSYTAAQATYQTATQATVPEDYKKAELDLAQAKANLDLNQTIVNARTQLFNQGAIPGRDLDTAKATLVQAQSTYDIAAQHLESVKKVSSQAALQNAKGQLESAKGKLMNAQAQLAYTEIRSPINGVVTDRPLFAGETAAAGSPLITVMDTSALIAKMHVAQLVAQQLAVGAPATIEVPGIDDPVHAKVSLISPALDPGSTTVEVWLRIENRDGKLKAGTPVHASITSRTIQNALILPLEAIQSSAETGKFVETVDASSTAHKRPVTVGMQSDKEVQILKGLSLTDKVITTGAFGLDEGTKVKQAAADDKSDEKGAAAADDSKDDKPAAGEAASKPDSKPATKSGKGPAKGPTKGGDDK